MDVDKTPPMWRPSPTPEETWSDNENEEWPVKAIVGEEVRLDGTLRYEVRWEDWSRPDGSNTTWVTEATFPKWIIKKWEKEQAKIRVAIADDSLDMSAQWKDNAVHKRLTEQRLQAYDEKLKRRRRADLSSPVDWDAEIESARRRVLEPEQGELGSNLRVRRGNPLSAQGSSGSISTRSPSVHRGRRSPPTGTMSPRDQSVSAGPQPKRGHVRPRLISPVSSPRSTVTTPSEFPRKKKKSLASVSAGSSRESWIIPSVVVSQPTERGRISSSWNKAARDAGAAMVRISPDISDEDVPRNLRKFKYVERGYVFRDEELETIFNASPGIFTVCDCMTCSDGSACSCRDLAEFYDLKGSTIFAYSEGLFTFQIPRGVDVIECNKHCGCDNDCGNRVVQRPRNIALEVFDTKRCGWGVRALDDIPQGKVLGTYTGLLIRRDDVDELPNEHHDYMFDLDSTEIRHSENVGGRYTVDSYECGNWTRFVNHSCSPNMGVYCVVYDTIPYVNMPYVAFVASIDIPVGTELTIDYHPYAEENTKGKRSTNGRECRCGAEVCRGWFKD